MTMTQEERQKKSNRDIDYRCMECGRSLERDNFVTVRISFKEMGQGPVIKTRTLGWLCRIPQDDGEPSCLDKNEHFTAKRYVGSPGMMDTRLAEDLPPESPQEAPADDSQGAEVPVA